MFFFNMATDSYKTIEKSSEGYYKEKGSKFYSFAFPLESEDAVKTILTKLKKEHHSARHHCYAWQLGTENFRTRANDDGEPSSTAGKPILGQIQSFGVTNILIVVVRYFGGTLLGVSGLINAYRNAAADALNNARIIEKTVKTKFELTFTYNELNDVMHIIKQENYTILNTNFEERCSLVFSVRKSEAENVKDIFKSLYKVRLAEKS